MMKKILAALLVLACVAPAFAVSITATDLGSGLVQINYDATGEVLRGVALTVTATNATIAGTAAVTVPSQASDLGFNTFIDYAFSNSGTYDVKLGHPLAKKDAAGELTVFPANEFSLSMGVLDQGSTQGGIADSGILCTLQFDVTGTGTVVIAADTYRGGAVVGNTGITQPTLPIELTLIPVDPIVIDGTLAVAGDGYVNIAAESFTASGITVNRGGLEYQFTWGDGNVGDWSTATQTHTYSFAAANTYTISVAARATDDNTVTAGPATTTSVTEAIASTASYYADWITVGRPACWAFQKQCNGDASGSAEGTVKGGYRAVYLNDLDIMTPAYGVLEPTKGPGISGNQICADFSHSAEGTVKGGYRRVYLNDLAIMTQYYGVLEPTKGPGVPVCPLTSAGGTINYYGN